ncbi:unnamed protein product [Durusdinium trenchii]|uniref:Polycystin cation channel PKD1/PKD2 domain-containing protein n=1 Tax=Durusdinium trenchii TaxID=1381693 RepID=A0ABP0K587_9DINO
MATKLHKEFLSDPAGLDLPALRQLLRSIQAERQHRAEKVEVLEDRLQASNHELAFRQHEADVSRADLYRLQRADRPSWMTKVTDLLGSEESRVEAYEKQTAEARNSLEHFLRLELTQVFGRRTRDERGFVPHDDEMIQKSEAEILREGTLRDTVLVTYVAPYSEQKRHISYRVAEDTTVKTLKEDVCTYWGLNEVEFVLKLANNSKAHDSLKVMEAFRAHEESHLMLVYKTPKNISIMSSEHGDILPRSGRKRLKTLTPGAISAGGPSPGPRGADVPLRRSEANKSLAEEMLLLPGLFKFMTQRDRNAKKHLERLKLRRLCAYLTMALLTAFTIGLIRPPGVGYECVTGISEAFTGGVHSGPFDAIGSPEEIYSWLEDTVSAQVFTEDSMLREYNYLVGYLQVLTQRVAEPSSSTCYGPEGLNFSSLPCVHSSFHYDTAETSQPQIQQYFEDKVGKDGRSMSKPWEHQPGVTSGAGSASGAFDANDGAGQSLEYQLQYVPLSTVRNAFLEDLRFLRSVGWLSSSQTRALHVSFVAYNANYLTWIWSRYSFDLSAFGTVHPLQHVVPFRPHLAEYGLDGELVVSDWARSCLLLFIFFEVYRDARHAQKDQGDAWKRWKHFRGLQVLMDLSLTVIFLVSLGYRISYYTSEPSVSYAVSHVYNFRDAGQVAESYGVQVCLEAVLLALCLYRFVYFLRVSRHVFLIWRSVARSAYRLARISLVLLLLWLGFVVLSLSVGSRFHNCNRTLGFTMSCSLLMMSGDVRVAQLEPGESFRVVSVLLLFCFGKLVLANVWLAMLMQEYHTARVEAGSSSAYKWREYDWVRWILFWCGCRISDVHRCPKSSDVMDLGSRRSSRLDRTEW